MLVFAFLLPTTSVTLMVFRGHWSAIVATSSNSTNRDGGSFEVRVRHFGAILATSFGMTARVRISSTPNFHFHHDWLEFKTRYLPKNSLWLFPDAVASPIPPNEFIDVSLCVRNMWYDPHFFNDTPSFSEIHARVTAALANHSVSFNSLGFEMFDDAIVDGPFALPVAINGSMTYDGHVFDLNGYRFDMDKFVVESKIFGVWFGFHLLLSFLAWRSLYRCVRQLHFDANPVCLLSGFWHAAVDFAFSHQVNSCTMDWYQLNGFFLFLSMTELILAVLVSFLCAVGHHETILAHLFPLFYLMVPMLACFFGMEFAAAWVFQRPVLCSIAIFSAFIPQIWSNTKRTNGRHLDDWFSVFMGCSRLLLVWYFCFRDLNVKGVKSATLGVFLSFYLIVQVVIILLQNRYGGRLFVPKRWSLRTYHYLKPAGSRGQCSICLGGISVGEATMVTPCGHVFHRECLTEWTYRKLTCPVCRAELPPIL
jgi:hypothetical protein